MEILQIRYFLEVAQSQHMSASAEKLHIAQPALSQSIRRLENSLGVPLFEAKGRNIVLTEYGKYLQMQLTPILAQLDRLPETLQTMAKLRDSTIHLNVLAASTLVTSAVMEYRQTHGNVDFRLMQNPESDSFDLDVTTSLFYRQNPSRTETQFVCPEKIYLAVPNTASYRQRSSITLPEVAEENFVSIAGSRQFRAICDKFCRHAGIRPHIVFESDSIMAVQNMIASNLGVGFWPEFTWGKPDAAKVRLLEISDPVCSRDIVITHQPLQSGSRAAGEFFAYLEAYFTAAKAAAHPERE